MAAGNSTLNLALRITADLAEAKQGIESLAEEIKTTGTNAEASNQQWQATVTAQNAAAEAARQHTQSQQVLNNELNTSATQSQRAARSSEEVTAAWNAQSSRGHALYQEEQRVAQAEEAAAKAAEAHAKEVDKLKKDLDNLLGSIDPASKALGKLDAQEAQLRKSYKAGLIDEGSFNDYLGKLNDQREAIDNLSGSTEKFALNSRGAQRELAVMIRQLMRGDLQGAGSNMMRLGNQTGLLPPLFSATTLAIGGTVAALVATGFAITGILNDQERFNQAIISTGNYAGVTSGQLEVMTRAGGNLKGNFGEIRELLAGLTSTGKFTSSELNNISDAAVSMMQLTGKSAGEVVSEFSRMKDGVADWALESNKQYHWLDLATYQRISALENQGRNEEAMAIASAQYSNEAKERLAEIEQQLNWLEKAWDNTAAGVKRFGQALRSELKTSLGLNSIDETIAKLEQAKKIGMYTTIGGALPWSENMEAELKQYQRIRDVYQLENDVRSAQKAINDNAIKSSKELEQVWKNNASDIEKEAAAVEKLRKQYASLWATSAGRETLRDRGVTSTDGQNFSGGQWDVDTKKLNPAIEKAKQYNKQLQQTLDQKKKTSQLERTEAEIINGNLKNASKADQDKARALAKQIDAQEALNKSTKAGVAEAKKTFNENQRFVEQLEKQATKRTEGAAALRAEEIATRNLTVAQRQAAEAANAAINAREFQSQNTQLQIQYMKDIGDTAGASLMEVRSKYAQMRKELEASGNTEGVAWIDKLLPVAETKIRVDGVKKQLDDLFAYRSQQETSIQAQVQGGLLSEIQGRQRLIDLHQEVGNKIKAYLPQLKEMANQPGEAGEKTREMIRLLEEQLGKLNQAGNELTIAFRDGLQSGIESSLMGLAKGTMSLSDAVKNLAMSIVDSLAKIAAQQLASMATSSLMGSSGGMGGIMGSLFAADGGHIQGPGTSTSDSIPAMLSNNEFVTRAAVVQQHGALDFLHDFNRQGMAALEAWVPRARHSSGGLAGIPAPLAPAPTSVPENAMANPGAMAAPNVSVQQTLVLDAADLYVKGAQTVAGERQFMTMVRANVPTMKQMLGIK